MYRCKSTQSIIYLGENCHVGGIRLTQVCLGMYCPHDKAEQTAFAPYSEQPANLILSNSSHWHAPWASHEVLFGVAEMKGRKASHSPFSKEPVAFDSVPTLIPPQSPVPCPGHSRGHHTLRTGVTSPKRRAASLRQAPMQNNSQRPAVFQVHAHNLGLAPQATTSLPSSPGVTSFSQPFNKDPFSPWCIPSSHQNLGHHSRK